MASAERFLQPNDAWVARRRAGLAAEFRCQRRRRRQLQGATGALALALGAAAALIGVVGNSGPQSAYAGWTAVPARPTLAQIRAAESPRACGAHGGPTLVGPTIAEARGPFISLVFQSRTRFELCITHPGVWTEINTGPAPPKLPADAVANLASGFGHPGFGPPVSLTAGNLGSAVTALTLVLKDGERITATVGHGWALAWWPGLSYPVTATVRAGKRTYVIKVLPPKWRDRLNARESRLQAGERAHLAAPTPTDARLHLDPDDLLA